MPASKSQVRRFIEQNCHECKIKKCDFPLEWREGCPKWQIFEAAALKAGGESND